MARERGLAPILVAVVVLAGTFGPGVAAAQSDPLPAVDGGDSTPQSADAVARANASVAVDGGRPATGVGGPSADGGRRATAGVAPPADDEAGPVAGPVAPGSAAEATPLAAADFAAVDLAAGGLDAEHGSAAEATDEAGIDERIALRQHEERGYFEVTYEYDLPAAVASLNVTVPYGYQFVDAEGFERLAPSHVRWTDDGNTSTPSVTFRVIADVGGRNGRFEFVDAGDWALVRTPNRSLAWTSVGRTVGVETTYDVDGQGAVGSEIAYLGPHEEYVAEAEEETIRLVVPAAADLADPPDRIVDALARASDELDVGGTSDEVLFVAAPTGGPDWLEWAALGLQRGSSDAWVRDDVPLADVDSTWLHEYVHTRQAFEVDDDFETEWLVEAQAEYYASLLAVEFGYASVHQFRSFLRAGRDQRFDDAVLAERSTWRGSVANYLKGALVVGRLDFEIRAATDGALSFEDVFRAMNAREDPVDHGAFVDLVRAVGGGEAAAAADRYAGTTATPTLWDRRAHEETFDRGDSPVVYGEQVTFAVDSAYRETTLGGDPVVAVGENLTASVRVENPASFNATYEVSLVVDGEAVVTRWGVLGPGESRSVTLSHAFASPGEYELEVRNASTTVTVREPATPAVTGLSLGTSTVRPHEAVTVAATVRNDGEVPGERVVEIAVDGRTVATERVRLAPGEETTVRATVEPTEPGSVTVAAGNETVALTVLERTPTPTARVETPAGVDTPGFTAWAAGVALLALALATRRW